MMISLDDTMIDLMLSDKPSNTEIGNYLNHPSLGAYGVSLSIAKLLLSRLKESELKLNAITLICRETSDDYAPDPMPIVAAHVVERIEAVLQEQDDE